MKAILLGTASCIPQESRASSSMIVDDGKVYLIDCGGEIPARVVKAGYKLNDIDVILLSHSHGDHLLGIPVLLKSMELLGRKKELRIYCPAGAEESVRNLMELSFPNFWIRLPFPVEIRKVSGEYFEDEKIRAALCMHSLQAYAYRLGDLTYSSDTAPCERVIRLAENSKVLLHDSSVPSELEKIANSHGHSSARQAGIVASKANVEKLILIHLEPFFKDDDFLRDASEEFKGKIEVGKDFMVVL
jgi:ribonuclease Z